MSVKTQLGQRLKAIRKQKGLTQDQLAERMGRSVDAISNIERGKSLPSFETIELLCDTLGIELKRLFDFEERKLSPRHTQLSEELQAVARELSLSDLELAVEQVKAIRRRTSS
ncbi:helix-turn-helix transcriptional regulator [Mesorhizobium sp. KR1-2]|uniref:helix-turn-helix domain-containing protein n=1 Tax=Mesorhizobium sp. KR1-2 TaxID=3156609 RepID=UPI0032B362E7